MKQKNYLEKRDVIKEEYKDGKHKGKRGRSAKWCCLALI